VVRGALGEQLPGSVDVAVVGHFVEREGQPSFDAGGMVVGQAEGLGDTVGGLETNAIDVAFELGESNRYPASGFLANV
jgi:hypothetical protein